MPPDASPGRDGELSLLSFNIQAGTSTTRYHEYVLHSWRHVLPHSQRMTNLDSIADLIRDFDVVALQEVDAGSLRSGFVNQTRYLASHSGLPYWSQQSNRRVGRVAYAANGFLSRYQPERVEEHRLPGTIPGRGAMVVFFGDEELPLAIVAVHLALGRRARIGQLEYLARQLEGVPNIVVMGDLNTSTDSGEVAAFADALSLATPTSGLPSFPSWQPQRAIDHILVSDSLDVVAAEVLPVRHSDHCPVVARIRLPEGLSLRPAELPVMTEVSNRTP